MRSLSKRFRRDLGATTALSIAGALLSAGAAEAATYFVSTADELAAAIGSANANPGNDVITLTGNINLNTLTPASDGLKFLPPIGNTDGSSGGLAIDLGGNTISGNDTTRVFFANHGDLSISNGTIADGLAQGGNGGLGDDGAGGGGMGAGGALYVRAGANVTVDGVSFTDNQAKGGNSGGSGPTDIISGGGGGGLGGNGGSGSLSNTSGGSGGGGGAFANGQTGHNGTGNFTSGSGGGPNGGNGTAGSNAGNGGDLSGGGGSGGPVATYGKYGGAGGYGGGGGGTASQNARGGAGGYGGGGGGAGNYNSPGGAGGFGGGGGGGYQGSGAGGFGGGNGGTSDNAGGGGGAGFGGAIFVQDGGSLIIGGSGTISGGSVQGGTGGHNAGNGMARGSGIFLQNAGMTFAPGEGQTQTVSDVIADDTGNGGSSGKLIKDGAGTLILSGINTYSGGTTITDGVLAIGADNNLGATTGGLIIADGTLRTTAGFTSSRAVELTGDAGIETETGELELTGIISGTGSLTKGGAGTLILSGTNTYEGGTTIAEGVLEIGADGNLGAATGGLTIGDATLRTTAGFTSNRAVELTGEAGIETDIGELELAGNVTGEGSLTKTGAGTLKLTGSNDYTGGTTVADGTLLGDTDSLQGDILNEADLVFDQAAEGTYAGVLTGTGLTTKQGAGTLIFSADSSAYEGETKVTAGTFRVNGKLGGTLEIEGGRLEGSGTVGKTTIAAGATHAVGDGPGSQTVKGDYLNRGTLEIVATPTGSDMLIVEGTVDIDGATLDLVLSPATLSSWDVFNGPYVIIQNDGSDAVTGSFASITKNLIFLDPTVSTTGGSGNDVTLELTRNQTGFADVGETSNQAAAGDAVETLTNASAVWRALALSASEEEARALLDALSGEVHASIAGMFTQDSRFWRNAANDRLRGAFGSVAATGQQVMGFSATGLTNAPADTQGPALWTRGFGAWGKTKSDGNASDFTRNAGGFLAGADLPVGDAVRLGALAGYAQSNFDDDRDSSGDADSYQIGLYGGTQAGAFGLRAGLAYAWHDVDTERRALGDKLSADYDADTLQVFGETGYAFDLDAVRLEPFANAAYVSTHTDSFEEHGGPAALKSDAETNDNTFTTLGLRAAVGFELGAMPASFRTMAGWRHAFGDIDPESTFAFAGSEDFVIAGAPIARDAAVLEAGFDLSISAEATLGFAYNGEIADDAQDHGVNATLAVQF